MNTETSLTTKVCNYKPLPGASTLGEVIAAAGLHPDEVVAEILRAGDQVRADDATTLSGQMAMPLVIDLLVEYQRWRRGAEMEQPDPRRLGLALNSAIAHLRLLPVAPQPAAAPGEIPQSVLDAVAEAIGSSAFDCNRVWSAWSYGTMGPNDFSCIAEDSDRVAEIARTVIAELQSIRAKADLCDEVAAYLAAQDELDNWELQGPNRDLNESIRARRRAAREHLDAAIIAATATAALNDEGQLWCMHILGPDDVFPAPSKEHAEMAAKAHNALIVRHSTGKEGDVLCKAVVAPWPHSAKSHAEGVGGFITGHLIPAWQAIAGTSGHPSMVMQMIQKASFSTAADKQATLALASVMVPVPTIDAIAPAAQRNDLHGLTDAEVQQ